MPYAFFRNPRIAKFLKAFQYVEEYGEGIDRMCTELEGAGLNPPEYYLNDFIKKTIIYNSMIEDKKPVFEEKKVSI